MTAEEVLTKRGKEKNSAKWTPLRLWQNKQSWQRVEILEMWAKKIAAKRGSITKTEEVVRDPNSHTHEASAAQIKVAHVKTYFKKRAEETLGSPTVV